MPNEPVDWIEQAAKAGTELRALIQEAHGISRDLKRTVKELNELRSEIPTLMKKSFEEEARVVVEEGLAEYDESIQGAIKSAESAIERRFQAIAELLMGEDKRSKMLGRPSVPQLIEDLTGARIPT